MKKLFLWLALWPACSYGQVGLSYDSALTSADSLSIFRLLDSLITTIDDEETAQVVIRMGYNSNDTGQGSAFQLSQYGLSLGAAYYHPSGFFGDVSGYFSNTSEPTYYLTMVSGGYTYSKAKKVSINLEYRRSFYHFDTEAYSPFPRLPTSFITNFSSGVFSNNFTSTFYFEHKAINLRVDYSFLFDWNIAPAHRVAPTASVNWEKRGCAKTEKIAVFPSISWLYGSGIVPSYEPLFDNRLQALFRIRNGLPLFEQVDQVKWGTMNLAISVPVIITWKKWSIMASYTYNWPKTLPGESYILPDGGYVMGSLMRYINLKPKRKS